MMKKKHETVTKITNVHKTDKIKKVKLDTKPSDALVELIEFEKLLPIEFKFGEPTKENFERLKVKLPGRLQDFISDSNQDIEINKYFAFAETIANLRLCAKYLMVKVPFMEDSIDTSINMSAQQQKWLAEDRAKLSKKFPPKHKMFSVSGTQWLRSSPYSNQRKEDGAQDLVFQFANRLAKEHSADLQEIRKINLPLFLAVPHFNVDFALDFRSTYLMEVLKGIDVLRLKICYKCSHVFWAFQLNQKYCDDV